MLFSGTIGQVVNLLLAKVAVVDQISLSELWKAAAEHTSGTELDSFQKNVVWRGLVTGSPVPLVQVLVRGTPVPALSELQYGDVMRQGLEQEVVLLPTEECLSRYLINTNDYQTLKAQLGEFPFALLAVIARHGTDGILNADLARELGQDIRSLRLRLQKLELALLIVCRNVYINKKHTTHSVHVKFAGETGLLGHKDDQDESLEATRDVRRTQALIVAALKTAPNQLRGFSDLKKEIGLASCHLAAKFFRSVCLKMHRLGYIEKLYVELPETKQRVYALRYVKDLPAHHDEKLENIDFNSNEKDGFDDSDLDDDDGNEDGNGSVLPLWNRVFPPFHQIYDHIHASGGQGITAGEVCKSMFGISEYRPYTRLYEILPSYLSNSKNLKASKKYAEPYDEYSVSKLYENEGKLRFYKYFSTQFCSEDKPAPKPFKFVTKASKLSLRELQKKLNPGAKSISNDAAREKKRRVFEITDDTSDMTGSIAKKQKRDPPKKRASRNAKTVGDDDIVMDLPTGELYAIDVALAAQDRSTRARRKAAPKSFVLDDEIAEAEKDSGDEYVPKMEVEDDDDHHVNESEREMEASWGPVPGETNQFASLAAVMDQTLAAVLEQAVAAEEMPDLAANSYINGYIKEEPAAGVSLSSKDLPKFVSRPREKRQRPTAGIKKSEGSLKAITRRNHLLDILREEGGAAAKSARLCRKLDQRLKAQTATDGKTLQRDIAHLTNTGQIESKKTAIEFEGKFFEKRILMLTDPALRPTEETIERVKRRCVADMSRKNLKMFAGRLIQSHVELYIEKPLERAVLERGKGRLARLGDSKHGKKPKNGATSAKPHDGFDAFENIKRTKRPRKVATSSAPSFGPKRPRRNIKLEKAEATILYRSVVISKTFSRDAIDFDRIAALFDDIDGQILKQKWGTLRRLFGGAGAVNKGVETFQNMVLQGIEDGDLSEHDLLGGDLDFFLDFWKKFDTSTEFAVIDEMPLFSNVDDNARQYDFKQNGRDPSVSLLEKTEDSSMRQKEYMLGQTHFAYERNGFPQPKPLDEVKTTLKSIFATSDEIFDPAMVKLILGRFDERTIREATNELTQDREAVYASLESQDTKFVLGERFNTALISRPLRAKLLQQAASFKEILTDVSAAGKGLFLSQGIQPGEVASLLELVSDGIADVMRIDRELKFEGYESRLVDKEQIGCDIVVQVDAEKARAVAPKAVSPPVKGPCQPLWVKVNVTLNKPLWTKIILSLLSHVVFRPGITDYLVQEKMQAVLNFADYCLAIQWLVDSGCVRRTNFGGYVATNCWQYILGI